jgi:wyosine [tRNA(Phe)-imidazoG37] synthetase (radical SAM superfamily)
MKGVPGVLQEKLDEGMNVRHCALSLVGEPIMYPEINKYARIEIRIIRYKDFELLYLVLYEELYKDKKYITKTI